MRVCDKTDLELLCQRIGVSSTVLFTLECVINRVFKDGYSALSKNIHATESEQVALNRCNACSCSDNKNISNIWCVDNDFLSEIYDKTQYDQKKSAVDFFVLLSENDSQIIQLVEGKLGVISGGTAKRPRHPSSHELYDKYDWSVKRIGNGYEISPLLIVLFSKSTIEKMRYRFARFNRENHKVRLKEMCVESFLEYIEQGRCNSMDACC